MPKIGSAPAGEDTALDGTEKVPLTGSKWALVSRWLTYIRGALLDTDTALAADSDTVAPSQKAIKAYVDNAVIGLFELKGSTDCSSNPNYPSALKGDAYVVSVAGKIGGASGKDVDVGDAYIASANNAGGTEGSVGTSWFVLEHNITGAGGVSDAAYGSGWDGDTTTAPSKNAVYDKIETLGGGGGGTPPAQIDATDIANCVLWYDLDQETFAEGDAIGTLTDFSASSNNATQATAGNKPTARLTVANGKKGACFDGGDYLTLGTNLDIATNHTILIVFTPGYKNTYSPLLTYKQQGIYQAIAGTPHWGIYRGGDGYFGPIRGGQPQVVGLWGSSNSAYDMLHDYLRQAGSNTNAFSSSATSYVGTDTLSTGAQCHRGFIFEIRAYNAKIADADLRASIDWLLYKWTGVI